MGTSAVSQQRVLEEVQAAQDGVTQAGVNLARLLRESQGGLRAEKVTISDTVQRALEELRTAREHLETLERLALEPDE